MSASNSPNIPVTVGRLPRTFVLWSEAVKSSSISPLSGFCGGSVEYTHIILLLIPRRRRYFLINLANGQCAVLNKSPVLIASGSQRLAAPIEEITRNIMLNCIGQQLKLGVNRYQWRQGLCQGPQKGSQTGYFSSAKIFTAFNLQAGLMSANLSTAVSAFSFPSVLSRANNCRLILERLIVSKSTTVSFPRPLLTKASAAKLPTAPAPNITAEEFFEFIQFISAN